ncbi:hypothetical protein O6H91_09G104700 [Diphasiastrum complanatum]|uniref:Uncharacterized protein n=4 Tax=Diphasiastrum complanatum TaxID=34168 RepID=A0ACC2CSP3_DIPCM|nr:hypothetical protein O6H91_Y319100 [Diphasiastrum complanatum]KAJ7286734.1 hypothetical protein O6H91_Y319100 [Diphasiastrum complanatum]KAJ7545053.1 hypothetical protein O6H91_09G104700 [Diphasiastrum complanatum]KAJ7545054.1 hypothetical protein O6H91_09G104700 [Diphasiastrum complanatum]KAJ7545055.1 hypothetical protein O6H91_09G104700 [Diphasiastrum complanatum]
MCDPLGHANNWLLVRDSPLILACQGPECSTFGSNMEVDHTIAVEEEQPHNVEACRQRFADFLSRHTAYELLPESGEVVMLDVTLPVKQAFHILHEKGIPLAPLWDSTRQQIVGMLTASDFIIILRQLGNHGAILSEEELDSHTIAVWKDEKSSLTRHVDSSQRSSHRQLISVGPNDSLRQVADKLLLYEVATVPVLHTSLQDGSVVQVLLLASLSDILKCTWRHFRHIPSSLPLLLQPIGALRLGTWAPEVSGEIGGRPLVKLHADAYLSTALELLLQVGVSALPVVDGNGSLLDVYTRSDITALARDRAYTTIQFNDITVAQALQIGQGGVTTIGPRCHMCVRSNTLRDVVERLSLPGVRRVICVEAGSRYVEGMISLRDVFKFLLG